MSRATLIADRFAAMSASEKRLALAVAVLVIAAVVMVIAVRCKDTLDTMDATIESQEMALTQFTRDAALAEPIDAAFQNMAKQHSSQWTQEQIHDRLRVEIARLSLRQIPAENTPIPAVSNPNDLLVKIGAMPVGALEDNGEGYRSYQINFRTDPTSIQNIALFLERLQQSAQALRVDSLEITRQPLSTDVTANFRVTRTVIGDANAPEPKIAKAETPKERKNLVRNADFNKWDKQQSKAADWTAKNATLAIEKNFVANGDTALSVHATAANGELYQVQQLKGGATYEVQFDARASGDAQMRVVNDADGAVMKGAAPLEQSKDACRYRFLFTVPGAKGVPVAMRVPSIVLGKQDATLVIDNVQVEESQG